MTDTTIASPDASALVNTLISAARQVNAGGDTIEVLSALTEKCVALLPVAAAGILVRDVNGTLQVLGASNPSAHLLDLFQVQNEEGPCHEVATTGERVVDLELSADGKWPNFARLAREQGFEAVYALPLVSRGVTIGALNLFAIEPISNDRLEIAQALADTATLTLLHVDPVLDQQVVIKQIRIAVESRNMLYQAQGVIAQRFNIDSGAALERIRSVSLETQLSVSDVAAAVVHRDEQSPANRLLERE